MHVLGLGRSLPAVFLFRYGAGLNEGVYIFQRSSLSTSWRHSFCHTHITTLVNVQSAAIGITYDRADKDTDLVVIAN